MFDAALNYDEKVAYIYTTPNTEPDVARTVSIHPMVNLDYDEAGTLVGVEVL